MKVIKIKYEMKEGKIFTAGIVSTTKEKAVDFLYSKVGSVRIITISAIHHVHAVDDEIISYFIDNSDRVKRYKKRIQDLNSKINAYENDITVLQEKLDKTQQQPSSKDIKEALQETKKIFACPYCEFETEKKQGLKMHITKQHKEKKDDRNEDNTPENKS